MAWRKYRVSSGHLTLDNEQLEPDDASRVLQRLKTHLGGRLRAGERLGLTVSAAAAELLVDSAVLTLGWDIWSGLFLMAHDADGDRVLEELAPLLDGADGERGGVV